MRRVITKKLLPGMIAAEDVYNYNNQLLVAKGASLTESAIEMLNTHNIISIRVEDSAATAAPKAPAPAPAAEPESAELTYSEKIKKSPEFAKFKADYDDQIGSFRQSVISSIEKDAPIDTEALLDDTLSLLHDVRTATGVFDMLHCMREYDDSTFSHCINISLICNVFARWLRMSDEDIRTATACGLFADIGKLKIPQEILEKPGKLTAAEFETIKTHTVTGYQLLQAQGADVHVCNAALMHHERYDNSGYPTRLPFEKIDNFAKMVAIADVYDAMTSARPYRAALCPFAVIEEFEQSGLQKYDPQYILPFLENMVNTYISNRCRLSNGQEGDIIYINKDKLSRPLVMCGTEYVNLMEHPDLRIEALL